jgi:AcrR family transcriptional regulator
MYTAFMAKARDKDRFWTGTFDRLPQDKQRRILDTAKEVFAEYGYAGANIDRIARSAGISVGGLYKYFRNKENLFLTLIREAHDLLEISLDEILGTDAPFLAKVERIVDTAIDFSLKDPKLIQLYIGWTTQELAPLSIGLSRTVEGVAASRYTALVTEARDRGELPPDIDPGMTAFCLDNLFLLIQFAFASDYYRERIRLYGGGEGLPDKRRVIDGVLRFISFQAPGSPRRNENRQE